MRLPSSTALRLGFKTCSSLFTSTSSTGQCFTSPKNAAPGSHEVRPQLCRNHPWRLQKISCPLLPPQSLNPLQDALLSSHTNLLVREGEAGRGSQRPQPTQLFHTPLAYWRLCEQKFAGSLQVVCGGVYRMPNSSCSAVLGGIYRETEPTTQCCYLLPIQPFLLEAIYGVLHFLLILDREVLTDSTLNVSQGCLLAEKMPNTTVDWIRKQHQHTRELSPLLSSCWMTSTMLHLGFSPLQEKPRMEESSLHAHSGGGNLNSGGRILLFPERRIAGIQEQSILENPMADLQFCHSIWRRQMKDLPPKSSPLTRQFFFWNSTCYHAPVAPG